VGRGLKATLSALCALGGVSPHTCEVWIEGLIPLNILSIPDVAPRMWGVD
jgi:hypothetical protein